MATGNCPYCRKRDVTPKCDSCGTCRAWMHGEIRKTVKQILEGAERQATAERRRAAVAKVNTASGSVERIDKQKLVDDRVMCFAGLKPKRAQSRIARTKARAAGIAAQAKLRDRRRLSGSRPQQAAVH